MFLLKIVPGQESIAFPITARHARITADVLEDVVQRSGSDAPHFKMTGTSGGRQVFVGVRHVGRQGVRGGHVAERRSHVGLC